MSDRMTNGEVRRLRLGAFIEAIRVRKVSATYVARADDVADEIDAHVTLRRAVRLSLAHESCDFLANGICDRDDCAHCTLTKALEETK